MDIIKESFTKQSISVTTSSIVITIDPDLVEENIIYLNKIIYTENNLLFNNNSININNTQPIILPIKL
jgi:hypothetical protein